MEKSIKKLINYILIILVIGLCIYLGYNFGKNREINHLAIDLGGGRRKRIIEEGKRFRL